MPRIFISYSRKDEEFARRLAQSLSETGADIWIDLEDIPAGMKWSSAIQEGLDTADLMIVIISPDSMVSRNVEDEWQYYLDHNKPVIPILLQPAKIHFQLSRIQYIDFNSQNYYTALNQLYSEFKRKGISFENAPNVIERPPVSHVPPERQTLVGASAPRPPQPAPRADSRRNIYVIGAVVAAVAVIAIVGLIILNSNAANDEPTDVTNTPQVVVEQSTHTDLPPTQTTAPTQILEPTYTAIPLGFAGNPVTSNAQWSPVSQAFDGVDMVMVPAGCFTMGSSEADLSAAVQQCSAVLDSNTCRDLVQDERPQTQVCFEHPFWMDRLEVTNAAYGGSSGQNRPLTNVTWQDAQAYCESRGGRLPTEAEWEYAARGPDGLVYPWGNSFDGHRLNYCDAQCEFNWRDSGYDDSNRVAASVGYYAGGASWVGALDMSGNVWEWTSSLYWSYPYSMNDGRENASDSSSAHTLRGGSWNWIALDTRTTSRDDPIQASSDWYGFRCVRDY